MVKLVYCMKRLPNLSREEFQRYWYETHGPLVKSHQEALAIRRYVQVHTLEAGINDALHEGRGGPDAYDGVAELWWDSLEAMEQAMESEAGQAAGQELLEDERRFIDLVNSPLWIAQERPVIGEI